MQIVIDLSSSIELAGRVYFCIDIREWPVCHADLEHILHLEWPYHFSDAYAPVFGTYFGLRTALCGRRIIGQGLLIQSTGCARLLGFA